MKKTIFSIALCAQAMLSWGTAYHVSSAKELSDALLTNIEDYKEIYIESDIDLSSDFNSRKIYTTSTPFYGIIDGQGHTLKNLSYNTSGDYDIDNMSLIGVSGKDFSHRSVIRNLVIDDFEVYGSSYVGFLAGQAFYTTFENITVHTSHHASVYHNYCGNIAGYGENCIFKDIKVTGNGYVYADCWSIFYNSYAGGICGNAKYCLFYRCTNESAVKSQSTATGGIVGYMENSSINSCVNKGLVTSAGENNDSKSNYAKTGGLAGWSKESSIRNSISDCTVVGKSDTNPAITGYSTDCFITHDYYTNNTASDAQEGTECTPLDMKNGSVADALNAHQLVTMWGQNLGVDTVPTLSAGIRHEREMTSRWGTVCLPYAIDSNDEYSLYTIKESDLSNGVGKVTLKETDHIDANTPCFFKLNGDNAASVKFSKSDNYPLCIDSTATLTVYYPYGWTICGQYDGMTDLTGIYYASHDNLVYAQSPIYLPPYQAYLNCSGDYSQSKSFALIAQDDDDKIVEIRADEQSAISTHPAYNIAGQRISESTKGIVIKNGKKIIR